MNHAKDMCFCVRVCMCVCVSQGLASDFIQRLPTLSITTNTVVVVPGYSTYRSEDARLNHTTALQNTLRQLGDQFNTTNKPTIVLSGWNWQDDSVVQTLASAIPTLPQFKFGIDTDCDLTDGLLGAVIAMGPQLCSVSVPRLSLQADTHANTPWPWEQLTVSLLDAGQLAKLPSTRGGDQAARRKVCFNWLQFESDILKVCISARTHTDTHTHTHTHTNTHD